MGIAAGVLLIVAGASLVAMAVLSRAERLPRNQWVGYRLPVLVDSEDAWRRGHRASWLPTALAGTALIVCGIGVSVSASEDAVVGWAIGGFVATFPLVMWGAVSACRAADSRR